MKKLTPCTSAFLIRTILAIFITMISVAMTSKPAVANAVAVYELEVTYTQGSIITGPLSFGLSELPSSVTATYTLGAGHLSGEPGDNDIYFDEADVVSASVTFGDATWASGDLAGFSMVLSSSEAGSLTYDFSAITSPTGNNIIILNFPLTIKGTTTVGEAFEYQYTESTQAVTPIESTVTVAIDIKPGSDPNCFNINGHGVIPVAVLGSGDFDVSLIDLASVAFGGLNVRVRGNKGPLCSLEYSNEDVYLDLVCHFEDDATNWDVGGGEALLTGNLLDGTSFEGSDSICVVP